jgi:hypothetical protein
VQDAGVADTARLAVLHVSAGNPRRWPAERFAELAAGLASLPTPLRVILTSGPSEAEAAVRVATAARRLASDDGERIVRCGEFDLEELAALVDRSALYIGGDSGRCTSPPPARRSGALRSHPGRAIASVARPAIPATGVMWTTALPPRHQRTACRRLMPDRHRIDGAEACQRAGRRGADAFLTAPAHVPAWGR